MSTPDPRPVQAPTLQQLRLICIALLVGVLIFAVVVAFVTQGMDDPLLAQESGIVATIAALFILIAVPAGFLLRGRLWASARNLEGDQRMLRYSAGTIALMASLEGCILLNLVAWLLTANPIPNVPVAVVAFAIAMSSFPNQSQLDDL
jgi:drug/metabolite transporter (DMT)-like permease